MFKKIVLDNFRSLAHLEFDMSGKRDSAQKFVAIYGENGSGKSNLMESVKFLKDTTMTFGTVIRTAFMNSGAEFDSAYFQEIPKRSVIECAKEVMMIDCDEGMRLEYHFSVNGNDAEYSMGFSAEGRIDYEKLRFIKDRRMGTYFEIRDDGGIVADLSASTFQDKYRSELQVLIGKYWGRHSFLALMKDQYENVNAGYMSSAVSGGLKEVLDYIGFICVGFKKFGCEGVVGNLARGKISEKKIDFLKPYEVALSKYFNRIYTDIKGVHYDFWSDEGVLTYRLIFEKRIDGKLRNIPYNLESTGTRKLLDIFPCLVRCIEGGVAFIDELDTGVHDKLVFDFIREIMHSIKGQLVITTHNTSLLQILEPRSTFILSIDINGKKTITPISAIAKTQKNNNNRDRYLYGLFEGVPYIAVLAIDEIVDGLTQDLGEKI